MKKAILNIILILSIILISSCSNSGAYDETCEMNLESENSIIVNVNTPILETPPLPTYSESMPTFPPTLLLPLQTYQELIFLPPDENGIVWLIPPTFEYETIFICHGPGCEGCNWKILHIIPDVYEIGKLLDFFAEGSVNVNLMPHGFIPTYYFFDETQELFAVLRKYFTHNALTIYTFDEFEVDNIDALNVVRKIDLSQFEFIEYGVFHSYGDHFEHLRDSNTAVVRGNTFLTDFIFDSQTWWSNRTMNQLIPVMYNEKVGLLDINGDIALSFIFEQFSFIDDNLAFARIDNMFGILCIQQTIYALLR